MNRLYIVEGIPGSGKTTYAKRLAASLRFRGEDVDLYVEGDLHPADMAWCALLSAQEYEAVCEENPALKPEIEENASAWNDRKIVAYTRIPRLEKRLYDFFESKEVYDGRVPKEAFSGVHESRWRSFAQRARGISVFECALMQNHVNELALFHCAGEREITEAVLRLVDCVRSLDPVVLYLNADSRKALDRAARSRLDENGERVWESRVAEYIENSPYGKKTGLAGVEGMYRYFEQRRQMELRILASLPVETRIVPVEI